VPGVADAVYLWLLFRPSVKRFLSKRGLRRLAVVLAVAYPALLLVVTLLFRFVGERWWVTAIGMFLPRIGFALPLFVFVPMLLWLREWKMLSSQGVAFLLVLFPLMGFVLPGPTPSATGPGFRLMSFNVNSAAAGREAIFDAIVKEKPDIVMLQEATDWSKLHELLHERFPVVEISGQFVLASRWPLISTTNPPRLAYYEKKRSPRFLRQVIRTPMGSVTFYNVHPLSPRESFYELRGSAGFMKELFSGRFFSGSATSTIEVNAGLRALQVETFGRMASLEQGPVVLAGDVNQPDPSPLVARALGGFRDAFREAGSGFGYTFPGAAFKARRTPKIPFLRLDRILLRGPIASTSFSLACRGVSDHLCIVADLSRSD
jgi:endonuclease/exonuclease/phosphatase (EEP) superfamily protein YafD